MEWAVPGRIALLEGAAALGFALAAALSGDPVTTAIAGVAAGLLAAMATRDRLARVRLTADQNGLTVLRGFARRRRIPWAEIEAVRAEQRSGRGSFSRRLEIDTGESLHLISGRDLGADPADVAAVLNKLKP